jgi:hypothetical protein
VRQLAKSFDCLLHRGRTVLLPADCARVARGFKVLGKQHAIAALGVPVTGPKTRMTGEFMLARCGLCGLDSGLRESPQDFGVCTPPNLPQSDRRVR